MTKNIGKYILVGLIVMFVLVFMFKIYIVVDPGEKAVIFNKATGNLRVTPNEGFYFLVPLIEEPTVYDMKARTYTMSIATLEGEIKGDDSLQALTSDGQTVLLDISVRYHPDVDNLDKLHRRLGVDFVNKVLRPQVRSIVRMIVSEYPVLDVYSGKRMLIQSAIEKNLRDSFKKNFITCEEVLLRNVQFSREFQQAIENKQIAQQEAQRMKYVLEKQELEKKRKIIEAEGESESLRLKGKALADNPSADPVRIHQAAWPPTSRPSSPTRTRSLISLILSRARKSKPRPVHARDRSDRRFLQRQNFRAEGPGRTGLLHHARRRPGQKHHFQPRIRPYCRRSSPPSAPRSTTGKRGSTRKNSAKCFSKTTKNGISSTPSCIRWSARSGRNKIRAIEDQDIRLSDLRIGIAARIGNLQGIRKDHRGLFVAAEQLRRAMARDKLTRAEAQKRIQSQFPLKEKLKVANYTIDSSGSFENTRANTMEVFHLLKKDFNLL